MTRLKGRDSRRNDEDAKRGGSPRNDGDARCGTCLALSLLANFSGCTTSAQLYRGATL